MPKMQIPKKIRFEDFSSEDKEIVERIGFAFNSFSDEVYQLLNGGLDSNNLNRQIVDIDVIIDGSGKLQGQPQIKLTTSGKIRGLNVINALNLVNSTIYPTQAPFVSFTASGTILTINNISGLQSNSQYRLTLELIV